MTVALRKSGKQSMKARHTAEMARGERHTFQVQNRPGIAVEPRARDRVLAQDQR